MRKSVTRRRLLVLAAAVACSTLAAFGGHRPAPNHFHFSILGDRTSGIIPGVYARVWREVDLLHPDFVINVGDTIQGRPGLSDAETQKQCDALAALFWRYRRYPLYFTPGNHDVFSDGSARIYETETGHPLHYSFDYQRAHFTILDNSRTEALSPGELDFLEQDLKKHRDRNPKFVFFHKPYWLLPVRAHSGQFRLHRLARKYGVGYIISGHGHRFVHLTLDGVTYLEVGSSGANMGKHRLDGRDFAKGRFFHHVWVTVTGHRVEFTVKELDGARGKGRMFRARDWGPNGPQFNPDDPAAGKRPPA